MSESVENPTPQTNMKEVSGPFWAGAAEGRLVIQRSVNTGKYIFYPRVVSPAAGGDRLEWVEVSGRGKVVWLRASPEALAARINADPTTAARRPNLTAQGGLDEIRGLLAQREPLYAAWADLEVNAEGQTPDKIAEVICTQLRLEAKTP